MYLPTCLAIIPLCKRRSHVLQAIGSAGFKVAGKQSLSIQRVQIVSCSKLTIERIANN